MKTTQTLSGCGDIRLEKRGGILLEAFEHSKNSSIHKTFGEYRDQKAAYRFFANSRVNEDHFIKTMSESCGIKSNGKRVLAICDTSTINTNAKIGRITNFDGLGIISRNQTKSTIGFFIHPIYVEDEMDGTPYGLADIKLYNRSMERITNDRSKRDVFRSIPIEEKESNRWVDPCIDASDGVLREAAHITYVMDREGDIIEVFERIPSSRADVIVRNTHNRNIINELGEKLRLYDQLASQQASDSYEIELKGKKKTIEIKWGSCHILAPRGYQLEAPLAASYVEVCEITKGDSSEKPIHWILISSKEISTDIQAKELVWTYQRRWNIEVFFKLMKSDGFNIEKTEMETGSAIRKLTLMIMQASIKILQLKAARTGGTDLLVTDVFKDDEIRCLEILNKKLGGATEKQQNPYKKVHLSWASWIIARLGGWKEFYDRSRPPGNKTFRDGLEKFDSIIFGLSLKE